jgi:hypothetical protein
MKVFRFAVLALLAPCAALANTTEDIRAGGGAVIPSLGVSIGVAGNPEASLSHAIDMGFSYAHAKRKQEHEVGDGPIVFGGQTFVGQQDIEWTSNIQLAHIGYQPRYWFGNSGWAIEGLIGLGWAGLGIKGAGANGQSASERLSNGGIVFGIGGIWRFAQATSLQLRLLGFGSGKDEGVTSASRWDLTVVHALGKNVHLRGGLGILSATSTREDTDSNIVKSPIRASGAGLTLGVDFVF